MTNRTLALSGVAALLASNNSFKFMEALEADMQRFREVALTYHPTANADYVRTVSEEIVRRGQLICKVSVADPGKVVPFLLECCRKMLHSGARIEDIGQKLPRDLNGLGLFIMEMNINPNTGLPLTDKELRAANRLGKLKLQ